MAVRLVTVGHGTLGASEFAELVRAAGIAQLIDVRSVPKSLRHPHFRREEMERWLPAQSGSAYEWRPALGGFRKPRPESGNVGLRHPGFRAYADYMQTSAFATALDELAANAACTSVAVMCSESLWWRCHRRLIADAATLLYGLDVQHLMHDGKLRPHVVTAGVRLAENQLQYDVVSAPST